MFDFIANTNISGWTISAWFVFCWFIGYGTGCVYAHAWRVFHKWR